MGIDAGAARRVRNRVDFIPPFQEVQCREYQTDLGPKAGNDELASAQGLNRSPEFRLFPSIHGGPVDGSKIRQNCLQRGDGRRLVPGIDSDSGKDDRHLKHLGHLG